MKTDLSGRLSSSKKKRAALFLSPSSLIPSNPRFPGALQATPAPTRFAFPPEAASGQNDEAAFLFEKRRRKKRKNIHEVPLQPAPGGTPPHWPDIQLIEKNKKRHRQENRIASAYNENCISMQSEFHAYAIRNGCLCFFPSKKIIQ